MADKQELVKQVSTDSGSSNGNQLKIDENENQGDEKMDESLDSSKNDSLNKSSSRKSYKRVDRGLDGGYWGSVTNDRKRRRTNTDRLTLREDTDYDDVESSVDIKSDKANVSIKSSNGSIKTSPKRKVLFKAKTFITVRNDENGFYLCQLVNPVYDDTQRCKIQWLEDNNDNKYKLAFVDYVDQQTIIASVGVNRLDSRHYSIKQEDLDKVQKLLDQAIKQGGIELDEDALSTETGSEESSDEKKSEESSETEEETETEVEDETKYKKRKISEKKIDEKIKKRISKITNEDDLETDEASSTTADESTKQANDKNSTNPKSRLDSIRQKVINNVKKHENTASPINNQKSSKLISLASNVTPAPKIELSKSPVAKKKKVKPLAGDSEESQSEVQMEIEVQKKEIKPQVSPKIVDKQKLNSSLIQFEKIKPQKPTNENGIKHNGNQNKSPKVETNTAAIRPVLPVAVKVAPLAKPTSELKENPNIRVYLKDPFFEDDAELPFISPLIQSKLIFRAIYLNNNDKLKALIDDREKLLSIHIKKSIYDDQTPLKYAIEKQNLQAIELLLDNFNRDDTNTDYFDLLIDNKFQKYTQNDATIGKLSKKKEGLKGLLKDFNDQIDRDYMSLIKFCLQTNVRNDILDVIQDKLDKSFLDLLGSRISEALIYGNRQLAAHLISLTDNHEFTELHKQVLIGNGDCSSLNTRLALEKTSEGITPVHCACLNPNRTYLKFLLTITQEYGCMDNSGRKPIHYAAVCELVNSLECLVSRGQSLFEQDNDGNTPLHYTCLTNRFYNADFILRNANMKLNSDPLACYNLVNQPNKNGETPLHLAISKNSFEVIKVLLKYGAQIDDEIIHASRVGNQKIVQHLFENGANIEATDEYGRSALHHSAINSNSRTLSFLLRQGLNPNQTDSNGNTPLHFASAYGSYFCVKILLDSGANSTQLNDFKLTPFALAFLKGHLGICEVLLQGQKIDINYKHDLFNEQTLLMIAISNNRLSKFTFNQIDYLINQQKANCKLVDSYGNNALHYLALNRFNSKGDYDELLAKLLIENGCDAYCVNHNFEIPLFNSINSENIKLASFLIENFQNINFRKYLNINGESLLHILCKNLPLATKLWPLIEKYNDQFEFLATLEDKNGQTPLALAIYSLKTLTFVSNEVKTFIVKIIFIHLKSDFNKKSLIFELIDDRFVDLFEMIIKESQVNDRKIDFTQENITNSNCLASAIELRQVKIAELLVKNSLCSLFKFTSKLSENPLQIAIRHKQFEIFDLMVKQLNNADLRIIFQQHNIQAQNIFHIMASSIKSDEDRVKFKDNLSVFSSVSADILEKLINSKDINSRTPLHLALINRKDIKFDISIEKFLITNGGADCTHKKDKFMRLPLHYLFCSNIENDKTDDELKLKSSFEIIPFSNDPFNLFNFVLQSHNGKSINDKDIYGYTPLHYAVLNNAIKCCEVLIESDFKIITTKNFITDYSKNTPLSSAIYYQRNLITKLFLDTLVKNSSAKEVLKEVHCYPTNENSISIDESRLKLWQIDLQTKRIKEIQLLELIFEHGWFEVLTTIIEDFEKYGLEPLNLIVSALNANSFDIALDLFNRFENEDRLTSKLEDGRTLLHLICLKKSKSHTLVSLMNKLLNSKSGEFFLKEKDYFDCTALHYACLNHNYEIINKILQRDANLAKAKDSYGQTAFSLLFWSIGKIEYTSEMKENILSLVKDATLKAYYPIKDPLSVHSLFYGVKIDDYPLTKQPESKLIHPFLYVINQQDLNMVKFFIDNHLVDVNLSDLHNIPALVYAIQVNNIKIVRLLLGIDPENNNSEAEIKSNLNLFHLDSNLRNVFHHLAMPFDNGSFFNTDILDLLLKSRKRSKNEDDELKNYLTKPDNKSLKPHDYALKHGNVDFIIGEIKNGLQSFHVNDSSYDILHAIQNFTPNFDELPHQMDVDGANEFMLPEVDSNTLSNDSHVVIDFETKVPYECYLHKFEFTMGYYDGQNTYLKMQLLQRSTAIPVFIVYAKTGRVGDSNGNIQEAHYHNIDDAKSEFNRLFKLKTGNDFGEVVLKRSKQFEYKLKKFYFIDSKFLKRRKLNESEIMLPTSVDQIKKAIDKAETIDSKLNNNEVMKLFFDLMDVEYFKEKVYENTQLSKIFMPISKLEKSILNECEVILKNELKPLIERQLIIVAEHRREDQNEYHRIIETINQKSLELYSKLSLFDLKFEKFQPISNYKIYDEHLRRLTCLNQYFYETRVLMGAYESMKNINPIDYIYKAINCKIEPLKAGDWETNIILSYCWSSEKTAIIEQVYKIEQRNEAIEKFNSTSKNRVLLFYSADIDQILDILSNGLNINQNNGVVFYDSFKMSDEKTKGRLDKSGNEQKYLLLFETYSDDERSNCRIKEQYTIYLSNGCKVPLNLSSSNKYLVYNNSNLCLRYLIKYHN